MLDMYNLYMWEEKNESKNKILYRSFSVLFSQLYPKNKNKNVGVL